MFRSSHRAVFVRRWSVFVSAIWLMIFSGTFGFSNYSSLLKEVLGLNQKQLNRLSVAKDLGDTCGILAGVLSNYLPAWGLLCIGATVGLVGYGTQWLVVSQIISPLPFGAVFIACAVAGNSVSWINTATFTISVKNFPRNRGPVVGLFKAYMGLSAAIFARICNLVFSSSSSKYLLLQTFGPSIFCVIGAFFIRPVPPAETEEDETEEKRSLLFFNLIACCLAIYVAVLNIFTVETQLLKTLAVGLLIVLAVGAPVLVPAHLYFRIKKSSSFYGQHLGEKEQVDEKETEKKSGQVDEKETEEKSVLENNSLDDPDHKHSTLRQALLNTPRVEQTSVSKPRMKSSRSCHLEPVPELGEDRNTLTLFRSWDFYVLYFTLFCGAGSGVTFSNNLGQIGQSLGFATVTVFTSSFSLGNFFGRIASGIASEHAIRIFALPRPAWIGAAKLPMIGMFLWLAGGSGAALYTSSALVGFSYGSLISLTIPTVSEFYGLKQFGTNFMVINTHLLAGSAVLSGLLAGYLYDQEAESQQEEEGWMSNSSSWRWLGSSDGSVTCDGSKCYGVTFIILAGLISASLVLDMILVYVTRPLYKKFQWIYLRLVDPAHRTLN